MAQAKTKRKYSTKSQKNERPQRRPSGTGTGSGSGSGFGQRMLEDMQLHGFSKGTQKNYMDAVRTLANHYQRRASQLTEEQVRNFFLFLTFYRTVPTSQSFYSHFLHKSYENF